MTTVFRNGRNQLMLKIKDKPAKNLVLKESELERGRIRKAIEDRRIQRELMEGDLW